MTDINEEERRTLLRDESREKEIASNGQRYLNGGMNGTLGEELNKPSSSISLNTEEEKSSMVHDPAEDDILPSTSEAPLIHCKRHTRKERQMTEDIFGHHDDECHDSETDEQHRRNSCKVSIMITITFLFFFVELFVGILNQSIALLADSYHMLSDVMALIVAFLCLRISRRKSKSNGFGWVRAEVLGALANGVFLLAMCFTIALEAFGRIVHPRPMTHPLQVLVVGIIGLVINLIGIGMFHGGGGHGHSHGGAGGHGHSHNGKSHSAKKPEPSPVDDSDLPPPRVRAERAISQLSAGVSHNHLALKLVGIPDEEFDERDQETKAAAKRKEAENLNMRGVLLHIMADAIGSIFVITTAACSYFLAERLGPVNNYLDPILSLTLVSLICFSAYNLVVQTADIVMRRTPNFLDIDALRQDITGLSGVSTLTSLEVWTLVGNRHIATVDVEFCSVMAFDVTSAKIRRVFHRNNIHSLTIQPSFSQTCLLEAVDGTPNATPEPTRDEIATD